MMADTRDQFNGAIRVEAGNRDVSIDNSQDQRVKPVDTNSKVESLSQSAWVWICWSGTKTFNGMEFVGEVLANFLGLTQSKYQWIIDAQEREKQEVYLRRLEKRQRRQLRLEQLLEVEQRKLEELEVGAFD